MLSKNNNRELQRKIDDKQDRFTLRKLSIGVASVLLGSFIMGTQLSQTAYASNDNSTAITETTPQTSLQGSNDTSNQSSTIDSTNTSVSASSNQNNQVSVASEEGSAISNSLRPANSVATTSSQSSQTSAGLTNNNPSSMLVMAASRPSDSIQTLPNNSQASLNTQQASITDAPDYPNTNGIVPQNQYIFDQFHLTNGQLTDNAYTPLNMVITLATNRNEPGGILNYYITNDQYTQQYSNGTINVGEMQTYEGPYQGSKINIYNFGENGISVNELNNNYGLAFTFGYGKYQALIKENPNPYAADSVSNAWGDAMPEKVTQTIKYVNEKTGEEISGIQPYTQTGLTGQVYSAGKNDQIVIKGYYLVNSSRANGIISQFHNGGTYTNEWVSASGQLIKEVWHQISQNGLMQCDIYINGQQQYDPNNLKGIVYPSSQSSLGPTSLSIQNGNYVFPNPYVEQTQNIELKYLPLGKIIPVLPNGEVIPNAPQPQYQNNPNDPTGVKPDEPVPVIPGYTPQEQTVTPEDPGKDTQVIYTPIQQGSITVTVHDVTDNVNLPQYGKSSGEQDVGTGFTYDKNTVITDLENKGYKVLNPDVVIPTTISKGAQNIVINVEHELVPVTPENPGTPGQPINPNDPDGPKWPDGTAKDDLEATGTQTIHYEGAGDKTPADNTQHFTFTKSATVDKVTGKIVSETGWNVASHTFGNVDTPVVAGYHADKAVAGGATITPDDLNKTIVVTYAPNGHVIPVGPDGTPIPGADQPQFPTNPGNPTGTTPSEVPVVPGYHPETGKPGNPVDPVPGQPGEDVPVKYVPDTPTPETYTGSQTIKFVDGNGTELHAPDIQTAGDLTGDHTFGKINTPVIKGYTTTQTTAGGATVTKTDPNATITVTYTPNGHIIPVGPDGTPIPGADQPQFPTNPDNPSETTPGQVPDVPGYHPETGKPGDPVDPVPGQPGENVPVKYVPDTPVEQGSITVTVHDVTDNINLPQYGKTSGEENVGTTFTYDKNTVIQELENKGYKVLNPDVVIPTTISKGAQNIVINVEHELVPVTPENPGQPGQPINPNDPDGPKWPDGTAKDDLEATGTQTIHYEGAGDKTPSDNTQHFTFTKSATVDKVTGKIVSETGWNVASHTFGNVDTPVVAGYHADKAVAGGATITPNDLNKTIVVTYAPNGHIIPVGPDGNPISEAPQPQFPTNPDNPSETTPGQVPDVPGYHPETGKPGDPVDPVPGQPGDNVPVKYVPDTPTPETYTGSQTIKFVDGTTGKEIETPNVQTAPDLTSDHTFGKINTPVIKGYTTTQTTAGGATVTKNNPNATITVTYTPNGHVIPIGPDGTPIPGADQPQFPTNPDNPSETTPGQVPDVPGYHPETGQPGDPVDPVPGQPGEDVPVKYVPDTPVEHGSITVTVRDTTDNVDLPQYGKSSGEENVGTTFTYDKNTVIQELENKGYKVLNPDVVIPTTISKGAQNIVINVEHQLVPVTPENPGQPGQPINPNDPNGPKWPDGTAKDNLEVTGTQTIHYVGAGDQTPANNVQHFTFTKSAVVDKVTGKIVSETDWNVASHTFGNINTPVVPGYHADKAVAGGTTITPDDLNKTVTVTYTPNGHIIPVGPDGKPLPNVPQPQYPTNPNNPTEVTPNEPVPEIPGYTPNVSTVTPENPGENTPVVYTPNEKPVGPTTPSENGTSNGNTGNPTTPQPETPAKPMTPTTTPAGNGNIPTNGQTTSPAGSSVTTSNVNNANAITPAAQKQAAQLPQTGNEQLKHEGILGLLALGVAGLLAFGKKRRKE